MNYINEIGQLKSIFTKKLNDTFIWTSISRKSLEEKLLQNDFMINNYFEVPSRRKEKIVKRDGEQCLDIIKNAIEYDMYYSTLVLYVSMFDNYLEEIATIILKSDCERLLDYKDMEFVNPNINNKMIELCKRDNILRDNIIRQQISSLSYKSTDKWKEFYENVLELYLDDSNDDDVKNRDLWNEWKECKLIRNLIIHNGGYVDEIYTRKSIYNQFKNGEKVQISDEYISEVIVMLKAFSGKIANNSKMIDSLYNDIKISKDYITAGKEMKKDFENCIGKFNCSNKLQRIDVNVTQDVIECNIYIKYQYEVSDKDIASIRKLLQSSCKENGIIRKRIIILSIIQDVVKKYSFRLGGSWKKYREKSRIENNRWLQKDTTV